MASSCCCVGLGGVARYPATGLVTEQGVGGEPEGSPPCSGLKCPFGLELSLLEILDVSPES